MSHVIEQISGMSVTRTLSDDDLQTRLPLALSDLRSVFARHHVVRAYLFGSRARGTHHIDSDIDILYSVTSNDATIARHLDLEADLEAISPVEVDLASAIQAPIREFIEPDLIRIY